MIAHLSEGKGIKDEIEILNALLSIAKCYWTTGSS